MKKKGWDTGNRKWLEYPNNAGKQRERESVEQVNLGHNRGREIERCEAGARAFIMFFALTSVGCIDLALLGLKNHVVCYPHLVQMLIV